MTAEIEIKFDIAEAMDNYGDDTIEDLIIDFIEETYDHKKGEIIEGYEKSDNMKIKHSTHTLKTSARFIFEEGFASQCQKMENWSTKDLDWNKLNENKEFFFNYMDALYLALLEEYKIIKEKRGETISKEFLEKVPKNNTKEKNIEAEEKKPEEINSEENYKKRMSLLSSIIPAEIIKEDEDENALSKSHSRNQSYFQLDKTLSDIKDKINSKS